MSAEVVKRSQYLIPPATECPHSSRNHFEDWEEFHLPLARMHHAHLHDRGVASGLEVSVTGEGTEIEVQPGVAVDGNGELVALSGAGEADVSSEQPGEPGKQTSAPFRLSTASLAGETRYLTIQHAQIQRLDEGSCGKLEQTPWLRLQPTEGADGVADDGPAVVLAIVTIDGGGAASVRDRDPSLPARRRLVGASAEELRLRRSNTADAAVADRVAARLHPLDVGGLRIAPADVESVIALEHESGDNVSAIRLGADETAVGANLTVGGRLQVAGTSNPSGGDAAAALLSLGDGSNRTLLRLNAEQSWEIEAKGSGAGASLDVRALADAQTLRVVGEDGLSAPLEVRTSNLAAGNAVLLAQTGGKVGVGVSAPEHTLQVGDSQSNVVVALRGPDGQSESGTLAFEDDAGTVDRWFRIVHDSSANYLRITSKTKDPIIAFERIVGRVGIGTSAPEHTLQIGDAQSNVALSLRGPDGQTHSSVLAFEDDGGTSERWFKIINDTAGNHLRIRSPSADPILALDRHVGNVGVGLAPVFRTPFKFDVAGSAHASSFPTSSDERLKMNVCELSDPLRKIGRIRGVAFEWNALYTELGRSTGRREIGVLAQDVESVFPELISSWGEEAYRAVDYGRLVAVLLEAVKELQREKDTEVKALAERCSAQEIQINALNRRLSNVSTAFPKP